MLQFFRFGLPVKPVIQYSVDLERDLAHDIVTPKRYEEVLRRVGEKRSIRLPAAPEAI